MRKKLRIEVHRPIRGITIPIGGSEVVFSPAPHLYYGADSGVYFGDMEVYWTYPDRPPQKLDLNSHLPSVPEGGSTPLVLSVFHPVHTYEWGVEVDDLMHHDLLTSTLDDARTLLVGKIVCWEQVSDFNSTNPGLLVDAMEKRIRAILAGDWWTWECEGEQSYVGGTLNDQVFCAQVALEAAREPQSFSPTLDAIQSHIMSLRGDIPEA